MVEVLPVSMVVVGVFLGQIVVVTALPLGQKSISGAIGNNTSAEKGEKWAWLIEQLRVGRNCRNINPDVLM